jgi:TonB family protein
MKRFAPRTLCTALLLALVACAHPPRERRSAFADELDRRGGEVTVRLMLTINAAGYVTAAGVVSGRDSPFDELAREAALKMRFKPPENPPLRIPYTYRFVDDLD